MRKKTITLALISIAIVVVALFASLYYSGLIGGGQVTYQLPDGEPESWQIMVSGDFEQEKTVSLKELTQMQLTSVNVMLEGENVTFIGVEVNEFCTQTGISWDAGTLNFIGADGQAASLNVFQAWNSTFYPYYYNNNVIILAFAKDGEWLTSETGGPVRLIAPYFSADHQVKKVAQVQSEPWTIRISGQVANPLVLTGKNLSTIQSKTVNAEFRPGGSSNRTSDWTGLPILDVLEAANAPERAEQITIVAIDGYEKDYWLYEVEEGEMMIGFQENGNPLPLDDGGPYRLFAPTDKYKWGQFWVKFIKEIIVS